MRSRRPIGERHLFSKPYSENPAAAACERRRARRRRRALGRTFSALSALESRRTYCPVSCMLRRHRPWFAGSARSSEKRSAAASAPRRPSRGARGASRRPPRAAAAAPTSAARVVSRASCFASRRARSSSRSRASKSAGLRSVASAPHRATTSRRRRPRATARPRWHDALLGAELANDSLERAELLVVHELARAQLPVVGLTYATPTCLCSALTATRTAATTGASAISPPRYSSSSKAPSFPARALGEAPALPRISSYSSTVRSVPSSSRSRSTVSNRLLFRVTPASAPRRGPGTSPRWWSCRRSSPRTSRRRRGR